jgi:hypothetical protein
MRRTLLGPPSESDRGHHRRPRPLLSRMVGALSPSLLSLHGCGRERKVSDHALRTSGARPERACRTLARTAQLAAAKNIAAEARIGFAYDLRDARCGPLALPPTSLGRLAGARLRWAFPTSRVEAAPVRI